MTNQETVAKIINLFSNSEAKLSCNMPQYPVMIKQTFEKMGQGIENVDILATRFLPIELPLKLIYGIYMAYVLAGLVQKIVHKTCPLEKTAVVTDRRFRIASDRLFECLVSGTSKEEIFKQVGHDFLYSQVPQTEAVACRIAIP